MSDLLMPSEAKNSSTPDQRAGAPGGPEQAPIEPPSVKLIVRLFVIPLLIAIAVIAIMIPIGKMAGGPVSLQTAIDRLKRPGGERTMGMVGPGAKQRYMDAKTLVDHMKRGLSEPQRIELAGQLTEILQQYTHPEEGEVQHFILLALGRVWQRDSSQPAMDSPQAVESRRKALDVLMAHFDAQQVPARKAAILALGFWQGHEEARRAIPALVIKVKSPREDLDVRMAAIATLGNIAGPADAEVMQALNDAMRDSDPKNAELVWNAALSLAQFNRPESKETILMLLDRQQLAELRVYDRDTDPQNPVFRPLNEEERQRFLMNTMERARFLTVPEVQQQLRTISEKDPSTRVRAAAIEILQRSESAAAN